MRKIEVVNITKKFGYIKALDKVSFSVNKGDYIVILGPIGAGKTTLLRIIAGLLKPDEGDILIDGKSILDLAPEERNIGYMPQGFSLFPHMNVYENVAYGLRVRMLSEEEIEKRVNSALEMVGLLHRKNSYPHELSGGMRQRVALARALATKAEILLLDEPLSALDLLLNIELRYEIRELAKSLNLTVIHVTHNHEEAMAIADKILILRKGKVQQYGTPEEIYRKPKNLFVASFSGEVNIFEGSIVNIFDNTMEIELDGLGNILVRGNGFRKGDRVVVIYRPESIMISPSQIKDKKGNYFIGKVTELYFLGMFTECEIELNEGLNIRACTYSYLAENIREGEKVTIFLPLNEALIYPYPREGIISAISLG